MVFLLRGSDYDLWSGRRAVSCQFVWTTYRTLQVIRGGTIVVRNQHWESVYYAYTDLVVEILVNLLYNLI